MRYIIIGAGAVGGSVGARLFEAGHQVVLVARGAHLQALRGQGLTFGSPTGTQTFRVPAVSGPQELVLRPDDVLMLSVKLQDAAGLLGSWAEQPVDSSGSAGEDLPVFCLQNGVEGERMALRRFSRVYGVCVMIPAFHLEPGRVMASGSPRTGVLTLGRYPSGADDLCRRVSADLSSAQFDAPVSEQVMYWKYGKLLANLGNALEAVVGSIDDAADTLLERAVAEGRRVLAAAGIEYPTDEQDALARSNLRTVDIPGSPRGGGSSWQSLARGAGSVETDYLSGEIVLLGRLHGVPTPVNQTLQRVANRLARNGMAPGTITVAELTALIPGA